MSTSEVPEPHDMNITNETTLLSPVMLTVDIINTPKNTLIMETSQINGKEEVTEHLLPITWQEKSIYKQKQWLSTL